MPRQTAEQVYQQLLLFLMERGVGSDTPSLNNEPDINNAINERIFKFRKGTSFEFVGFKFLFTTGAIGHTGRFSRGYWNRQGKFIRPPIFQVIVAQASMNRCNDIVRKLLSRRYTPAGVDTLIKRFNHELEQIVAYFGVSSSTRKQLQTLHYRGFLRMRKLLKNKFKSTPKLGTMIWSKFYSNETGNDLRIRSNGVHMLKPIDFDGDAWSLTADVPTKSSLMANVYLDDTGYESGSNGEQKKPPTPVWIDDAFTPKFRIGDDVIGDIEAQEQLRKDIDNGLNDQHKPQVLNKSREVYHDSCLDNFRQRIHQIAKANKLAKLKLSKQRKSTTSTIVRSSPPAEDKGSRTL